MHTKGYVHRDIKPENFLSGIGETAKKLFLIDFGLCKRIVDAKSGDIKKMKLTKGFTGTARYSSINSHLRYS